MRNLLVFGFVALGLLFSGLGQATIHAATLAVSFPEVNGTSHTSGFPFPPVVVATDSFVVPAGQSVLSASFSGVFGYVGSTAQFDLLLNGVEFGSTFDVTPTPYTNVVPFDFNISNPFILSSLDGQSATLSVVQESVYSMSFEHYDFDDGDRDGSHLGCGRERQLEQCGQLDRRSA